MTTPALIDLDQELPGQRKFISCWVSYGDGPALIVDPGPMSTAFFLIARLRELGLKRLEFILLTHIHLDHAGAAAAVAAAYPGARVACHAVGVKHLVDPTRLWEGSREVLGSVADVYGRPTPVPADLIVPVAGAAGERATPPELASAGIRVVPTPGHAPHHVSFVHGGVLYVGEAAGTHLAIGDEDFYLRPATPPRFFLPEAVASLDRLLALAPAPESIAFAHYGLGAGRPETYLHAAREQLQRWVITVDQERQTGAGDDLPVRVHTRLLAEDPHYAHWPLLPPDIGERERAFKRQSLVGILGYLESRAAGAT